MWKLSWALQFEWRFQPAATCSAETYHIADEIHRIKAITWLRFDQILLFYDLKPIKHHTR